MTKGQAFTKAMITIFLGPFGVHKFMEHKYKTGILYFLTVGLCGIGWIYDSIKAVYLWFSLISKDDTRIASSPGTFRNYCSADEPAPDPYNLSQPFDGMDGHAFEHYCSNLLSKNGFKDVEVTRGSGDQGIDILAKKDGILYGIQCKCYSSDIGNKAVQEAYSGKVYYGCHVAAVLTNRHFTRSARELAESNRVLLWDREYLEGLIRNAK